MDAATIGALTVLALIDSTSFGTLGVPVIMLVQREVSRRALLLYLGTISVFYFALGAVLLGGATLLTQGLAAMADHPRVAYVQAGIGLAFVAGSFLLDAKGQAWLRAKRRARGLPERQPRHERWVARMIGPHPDARVVAGVAFGAGLVEAASMLPYLAAIGILSAAGLPAMLSLAALAAYVLVMALPAVLLLIARLLLTERVQPLLDRLAGWMQRHSDDALGWVVGIVGVLLFLDAQSRLSEAGAWPFAG